MTLREKLNGDIAACRQAQAQFANDAEQARVLAILNDGAAQQLAQTLASLPSWMLDRQIEEDEDAVGPEDEQAVGPREAAEFDALGDLELRPPMTQEQIDQTMRGIAERRGDTAPTGE